MEKNPSFLLFMRVIYTTIVFTVVFYGFLSLEHIIRNNNLTDPYKTPSSSYVAVLNQNTDQEQFGANLVSQLVEELTVFWRYGN